MRVERPFAHCCAEAGGSIAFCDCVNKHHGTAFFDALDAILDCPFCGSGPELVRLNRTGLMHRVVCARCIAEGPGSHNPKGAIEGWNKRSDQFGLPEKAWHLLKEIIGNGDATGRNPQIMVDAAIKIAVDLGEVE